MSIFTLVVGPLVVFLYKYQRGAKLPHWLLWVLLGLALYLTGKGTSSLVLNQS
jgi:hypothetical protein